MKFVFWQNILSIHQSIFLLELAKANEVILIVQQETEERRVGDGWHRPDFGTARVMVSPEPGVIDNILSEKTAIHIFSGVQAYPFVSQVFKKAIKLKLKIGVMSEPYDWIGFKGKVRQLRLLFFSWRYTNKIDFILAIGKKGRECFEKTFFNRNKIFDWGYFTEDVRSGMSDLLDKKSKNPKIIYVGRIVRSKGILMLVTTCKAMENLFDQLIIIGNGEDVDKLDILISGSEKYKYLGTLPNKTVKEVIEECDLMVLPSLGKDGWGAVVNEALLMGIPVITSDHCGASVLLDGEKRGEAFEVRKNNLDIVLKKWLLKGIILKSDRVLIRKWAQDHISGRAAAVYFIDVIKKVYEKKSKIEVTAPWLN